MERIIVNVYTYSGTASIKSGTWLEEGKIINQDETRVELCARKSFATPQTGQQTLRSAQDDIIGVEKGDLR